MPKVNRQVRYNVESTPIEQDPIPHRWTFMIINEPREIIRIRNRIYQELQPISDILELDRGSIRGSRGLQFEFFSFSSSESRIDAPSRIYGGRFKSDRDLYERDEAGLVNYLTRVLGDD